MGPASATGPTWGNDTLWVTPTIMMPVVPASLPLTFYLPAYPALAGLSVYVQIFLSNPGLPTQDPLLSSNGLQVILDVASIPYGTGSGAVLWMPEVPTLGTSVTLAWSALEF